MISDIFFNHYSQGQCCGLIDLIREYQNLKSTVCKVLESAGNVIAMRATVKDQEDLKWVFAKVKCKHIYLSGLQCSSMHFPLCTTVPVSQLDVDNSC